MVPVNRRLVSDVDDSSGESVGDVVTCGPRRLRFLYVFHPR